MLATVMLMASREPAMVARLHGLMSRGFVPTPDYPINRPFAVEKR